MWKEGKYIDLWSFVHFLFGVLFVFLADFFELTFLMALVVLTILATLWEFIEFASGETSEFFSNRITDIVFADIGFLFMYLLLWVNNVDREVYVVIFVILGVLFVLLNFNGWNNFLKKREQNN